MRGLDTSLVAADKPLTDDEVAAAMSGDLKSLSTDSQSLRILLSRVRATLLHEATEKRQLRRDITRLVESRKIHGTTANTALDALALLNDDEKNRVFRAHASEVVSRLRQNIGYARAAQLAATAAARRAELILNQAAGDPSLPEDARARLREHIARLPDGNAVPLPNVEAVPALDEPFVDPSKEPAADSPAVAVVDEAEDLADLFG